MSRPRARAGRRYHLRLAVATVGYGVALLVATILLRVLASSPWRYAVMVLPLLPAIGIAWLVLRYLREADELQARIQLESLGAAFAAGSLITFGYGLMQVAGAPPVSWLFVWPVYGGCWLVASLIVRLRY